MAAEAILLSPLPRKALDPLRSWRQSALQSPGLEHPPITGRSFWYDVDESLRDVHENYSYNIEVLPDWTPAFCCAASNASTSAGSSPSLGVDSPKRLIQCTSPLRSPDYGSPLLMSGSKDEDLHAEERSGVSDKAQVRKVFVGGIPQTVDQKELYKLFSKVGRVKKAWLQMYSHERSVSNAMKHRGFGFVIFSEKGAVDQLLGEDTSRFIKFGNALQFEVKRAVGKLVGPAPETSQRLCQGTPGAPSLITTSPRKVRDSRSASLQTTPVSSRFDICTTFPQVPPFPSMPSFPSAGVPDLETTNAFSKTLVAPWSAVPSQHTAVQCVMTPAMPGSLMDFLVGQGPQNRQELEKVLLRAMPDRYED